VKFGATVGFDELLAESDFVSINCTLTDETRHLFGPDKFRAMRDTAVLVNAAQGPVVDEVALAQALKDGEIFAAGIDVFERDPEVHPDCSGARTWSSCRTWECHDGQPHPDGDARRREPVRRAGGSPALKRLSRKLTP